MKSCDVPHEGRLGICRVPHPRVPSAAVLASFRSYQPQNFLFHEKKNTQKKTPVLSKPLLLKFSVKEAWTIKIPRLQLHQDICGTVCMTCIEVEWETLCEKDVKVGKPPSSTQERPSCPEPSDILGVPCTASRLLRVGMAGRSWSRFCFMELLV